MADKQPKIQEDILENIIDELPKLLVQHAYRK